MHKKVEPFSVRDVKGQRIVHAVKERASTRPVILRNVAVARGPGSVQVARGVVG